jgi:hypothetical protein
MTEGDLRSALADQGVGFNAFSKSLALESENPLEGLTPGFENYPALVSLRIVADRKGITASAMAIAVRDALVGGSQDPIKVILASPDI